MRAFVRFTSNSSDGDFVKGDTGVVDGYVNIDGLPYAVVILSKNKRFCFTEVWRMEFCSYGQTQENMGGAI